MTSDRVYVWTWLPDSPTPVVAGAIEERGDILGFYYAASYTARPEAISLYEPELPLRRGWLEPADGLRLAGALRDGSPDGWGRSVIEDRLGVAPSSLTEIDYMLASGSNRLGAIDFQADATEYLPRIDHAPLDELHRAAELLEAGHDLSPALERALVHGTSIGGARPKATVVDTDGVEYIAKFSSTSDRVFKVVNAEAMAMDLARRARIDVADTQVVRSLGKDVLLVRRFDRDGEFRRHVVSGLTLAAQDEMLARYVTYPDILDVLRRYGDLTANPGRQLFERIAFNMAISNSDDHARNHAAFWNGTHLRLTPAYDLAPGNRSGETAYQAMAYGRSGERWSSFAALIRTSNVYGVGTREARAIVDNIIDTVNTCFDDAAELARVPAADRQLIRQRLFLNPGVLRDE
ncbi:type II toxin-antitoxin system HipA family toxin [Nocardia sp. NPDC059177]|uniref:type II toxin-antitoxin system HipA family toxin n=1 Tax=Nocardia sp. NPDC059177 TaxID=3346759 RepID=UPI00369C4CE8